MAISYHVFEIDERVVIRAADVSFWVAKLEVGRLYKGELRYLGVSTRQIWSVEAH